MRKFLSSILALCLVLTAFSVTAFAESGTEEAEESALRISDGGTYVLTGRMSGTVFVDPGSEEDVILVLDGVDIQGGLSAAIVALSGRTLTIRLPENSVNRVTGGAENPWQAAVCSRIDTFFEGEGALYVVSNHENGIRTENAALTFNGGNYAVKASLNGISAMGTDPGRLEMNGGRFSIMAQNPVDPESDFRMNGGLIDPMTPAEYAEALQGREEKNGAAENAASEQTARPEQAERSEKTAPAVTGRPEDLPESEEGMPADGGIQLDSAESASDVVLGTMTNSAADLEADYENAVYITVTDDDNEVTISSSGTYVVTGECSDGNITVKKGTTGVVLVLEDLDLTSTTGATVSVNKEAEVKIVISGDVVLTDNEDPEDEDSEDEEVADAFDGAALKAKANSQVYVTGDGTLTINGNAKNGIKGGDESSLIFDGVTVCINAVNDGINGNYDVTLLSGTFTIAAGDDAIHADHILTIGAEDGTGPVIRVTESNEGLEGTVVNVLGGDISIVSADDAVNAANGDGLYEGVLDYAFNMKGGKLVINSQGDGIDSNGDVNLLGGSAEIHSSSEGGEAGIDYDGQLYMSDEFRLTNGSGTAGPDGMGMPNGQMGGMQGSPEQGGAPAMNGQMPGTGGQMEPVRGR